MEQKIAHLTRPHAAAAAAAVRFASYLTDGSRGASAVPVAAAQHHAPAVALERNDPDADLAAARHREHDALQVAPADDAPAVAVDEHDHLHDPRAAAMPELQHEPVA